MQQMGASGEGRKRAQKFTYLYLTGNHDRLSYDSQNTKITSPDHLRNLTLNFLKRRTKRLKT